MLVLTRKAHQTIMIGDDIEVSVLTISKDRIRIGVRAPRKVRLLRKEIYLEIQRAGAEREGAQ